MDNDITQHSTSSNVGFVFDEVKTYRVKYVEELEAESNRRLGMLRRLTYKMPICLICHGHLSWIGDEKPPRVGHADDCELDAECNGK